MTATAGTISLLVPSRGRPARCRAMWESAVAAAVDPARVELCLYLDDDDPTLPDYQRWAVGDRQPGDPIRVVDVIGPRILLTRTWNVLLDHAAGEILWHGNDDVAFRSTGWDAQVREAFAAWPDRIGLVHGRDGIHDANLATLGFVHRRWTEVLGYMIAPHFSSDYGDTWNDELARRIGRRRFLPGVFTEHLHPAVGRAVDEAGNPVGAYLDETHRERLARHGPDGNDQRWRDLAGQREQEAERLRAAMTS